MFGWILSAFLMVYLALDLWLDTKMEKRISELELMVIQLALFEDAELYDEDLW
jgi:uncharacterized membrane protein